MVERTETLRRVCDLIVDCPHFTPEWTDSGYIVVRNQNIRDGRLDLSQPSYTNRQDFERRTKRAKPKAGDIIFTREAPMGEVCMVPDGIECCVGQRQVLLRPSAEIDCRYLFYTLRSPYVRHQILWNEGTGSTVSNVRIPILEALKIPRLGQSEKAIGHLLGSLDDKIELNRQMNETLEAMAQAVFRDWFVDFGPTRRKLQGATDPLTIMGGLVQDTERAQALADLFPAALADDGLPEGWRLGTLGDLALSAGATVDPTLISADTPYIGLEHMPRKSIALSEWASASKVSSTKAKFEAGQILFGKLRPYFHKVGIAPVNGVCSTDIIVIDGKDIDERPLLTAIASSAEFVKFTDQSSTGTKMPRTSWGHMKTYPLAIASENVRREYGRITEPQLSKIVAGIHENRTLAATRDLLLPKLMSGEIRLPEAEDLMEAAQ